LELFRPKLSFLIAMLRLRLCLPLLAAIWSQYLKAGGLEKLWEVDLKKALQAEHFGPDQSLKVNSLSFSPDAQQIAVLLGGTATLFRVHNPPAVLAHFPSQLNDSFGWSPDGQIIHSGRHVVHLGDGKACDLPDGLFTHFIGNGSLVALFLSAAALTPDGKIDRNHVGSKYLKFYDANCQEQDSWEVPQGWSITDASPDRGLLSVTELGSAGLVDLIVDPFARRILHSGRRGSAPGGWFADRGKAICAGKICWDVDTAKEIGLAPISGMSSGVATRSLRVVLDDSRYSAIPFSSAFAEMAARRLVWDAGTGREVVSWHLKFLTYSTRIDLDGFNRDRRPIPCAISPDGEYIVEGGDGKIWEYRIRP
jgi:hypothetical protein